jgi:hypothetical protein
MHKYKKIFFLLLFSSQAHAISIVANKAVRGCHLYGFFAEFLWTLNHLEWCKRNKKIPVVYWGERFAYYSPAGFNGSYNAWEYYFEPVSSLSYQPGDHLYLERQYNKDFTTMTEYWEYIQYMHLLPKLDQKLFICIDNHDYTPLFKIPGYTMPKLHIYDRRFRAYVKRAIIDRYIKIKPNIQKKIDDFYTTHMQGRKTIGIHLRGKHIFNEVYHVPVNNIFHIAQKFASQNCQFLIATDQYPLLEEAKKQLPGSIIYYNCYRSDTPTSPFKPQQNHPQLGEDVLIEALLLSKCDHFIHTLSLVSTAVLFFNPKLIHTVLY